MTREKAIEAARNAAYKVAELAVNASAAHAAYKAAELAVNAAYDVYNDAYDAYDAEMARIDKEYPT